MTTKQAAPATPLPWEVHKHEPIDGDIWLSIGYAGRGPIADITNKDDPKFWYPVSELKYLATPDNDQIANAAYIVAACNAYPLLVAALQWIVSVVDTEQDETHEAAVDTIVEIGNKARAILRQIEGAE